MFNTVGGSEDPAGGDERAAAGEGVVELQPVRVPGPVEHHPGVFVNLENWEGVFHC